MTLPYAWSCLECPSCGAGGKSDLAARKHEDVTTHATTTHLERPEWRDPQPLGEIVLEVVEHLIERDARVWAERRESRETMEAQVKTAPNAELVPPAGALTTNKESPDG